MRQSLTDLGLPRAPLIIGHRGACGHAPENTLPSFVLAVEQFADMIELDLHLTRDGQLIASHDCDLARTSGISLSIEDADYDDLKELNVASYFGNYPPTTMPRVEEALAAIPADMPVNLELKSLNADPQRYADVLVPKLVRHRILISSFNWPLLREVRHRLPEIAIAPLADQNAAELPDVARELGATSAHCNYETITPEIIRALHEDNIPVLVYTVNDVAIAQDLIDMGVRGVFTNFPGEFVSHFGTIARN